MERRRDKMTSPGQETFAPFLFFNPGVLTSASLIVAAIHYIFVAVTLLHQQGTHGKAINSFAGPYIVYTDRFYMCERRYSWVWNIRTSHFNPQKPRELQILSGNLSGDVHVTDKSWLKIYMDTRSNNQWKENAFIFEFKEKGCQMIASNIPGFTKLFFGKSLQKAPCVINPGFYETNQQPIDWTFPNFPVMPYGQYKFRLTTGTAKAMAACFVVECHVVPKLN